MVYIPLGIGYAGKPETRVSIDDVIRGEESVAEPIVKRCADSYQALSFSIEQFLIDADEQDESLLSNLLQNIADTASERFTLKIRGENTGLGGAIYSIDDFSRGQDTVCSSRPMRGELARVKVQ